MTDPLEYGGANGATGATPSDQEVIRPHRAGANWGHRGHGSGPAPLAPPGPNDVGPRNPLKNNAGPTGPTGPTENDVPNVVRAVLAAFEPPDDPQARLEDARADDAIDLARDLYEERAAIREHLGGEPRAEAERAALDEAAASAGVSREALRRAVCAPVG